MRLLADRDAGDAERQQGDAGLALGVELAARRVVGRDDRLALGRIGIGGLRGGIGRGVRRVGLVSVRWSLTNAPGWGSSIPAMLGRTAKQPADKPESLVRVPKGFDADDPSIEDLKRKDHIAACTITPKLVAGPAAAKEIRAGFAAGKPDLEFLCTALGLPL